MSNDGVDEVKVYFDVFFKINEGSYFECIEEEVDKVILYCFVVGGVIGCYYVMYSKDVGVMMIIDVVFCCNDFDWFEVLFKEIDD